MHAEVCGYIKTGFMPVLCHCKLHHLPSRCFHYLKAICSPAAAFFLAFHLNSSHSSTYSVLSVSSPCINSLSRSQNLSLSFISLYVSTLYLNLLFTLCTICMFSQAPGRQLTGLPALRTPRCPCSLDGSRWQCRC